jgi:type IV secretion system protein VirB6
MLALTPLFAVLGGSVMLELAVPVLGRLTQSPGVVDAQAAMAFFLIGAVHVALMVMTIKVAGAMVSGWQVFGLAPDRAARGADDAHAARLAPAAVVAPRAGGAAQPAAEPQRRIAVSAFATSSAANENPSAAAAISHRTTRVVATANGGGQVSPLTPATSRTRGIGSRFRAPVPRSTEKLT